VFQIELVLVLLCVPMLWSVLVLVPVLRLAVAVGRKGESATEFEVAAGFVSMRMMMDEMWRDVLMVLVVVVVTYSLLSYCSPARWLRLSKYVYTKQQKLSKSFGSKFTSLYRRTRHLRD